MTDWGYSFEDSRKVLMRISAVDNLRNPSYLYMFFKPCCKKMN